MYVPIEHQEAIAETLAAYFHEENMVSFAKQSAELYKDYDEFTADKIMKRVKLKILQQKNN